MGSGGLVPGKLLLSFCMDFVILSAAPPGAVRRGAVPPGAVGRAAVPSGAVGRAETRPLPNLPISL